MKINWKAILVFIGLKTIEGIVAVTVLYASNKLGEYMIALGIVTVANDVIWKETIETLSGLFMLIIGLSILAGFTWLVYLNWKQAVKITAENEGKGI